MRTLSGRKRPRQGLAMSDEAAEFMLLEFSMLADVELGQALFLGQSGTEYLGESPGRVFGHEAYGALRRIAWKYRAARNDEASARLDVAMQVIGDRVKARPGVVAADVDRVIECLKADRCGCERCRYGV